ncbi:MAG: RecQ family ATP-dependent DNA helicase [Euzebya sp.]
MSDTDEMDLAEHTQQLIRQLAGADAAIRPDQLKAIAALLGGNRVLVVQRTGWGKTAVYLLATALCRQGWGRERPGGPTLLVSPLLALMRDQLLAAQRIGIKAATINSANVAQWAQVEDEVAADQVDLLLISPERLNHPGFRERVWPALVDRVGLVVIDEAHCISDWGHDFRPDYRRIADVITDLSRSRGPGQPAVGVLATTATANDRVVADVQSQLGQQPVTLRGPLDRASLHLTVHRLDHSQRLAWMADWIPTVEGSGIVYCLTVADTELVTSFLTSRGVDAVAYSGSLDSAERQRLEVDLKAGRVKVVVATSALGMGFDKPDLTFVIHHGVPSSPVAYYQAIGRAGRAVPHADVIALPGLDDADVWRYFESASMPRQGFVDAILVALNESNPISVPALETQVNAGRSRLDAALKILDVDGVVRRVSGGWVATGRRWSPDAQRLEGVAAARREEAQAMRRYLAAHSCLMQQLLDHLDDPVVTTDWTCGRCMVCDPAQPAASWAATEDTTREALAFLRTRDVVIESRRMWPSGLAERAGRIPTQRQAREGRALARGRDPGWNDIVRVLLAPQARPDDPAVAHCVEDVVQGLTGVLARWQWDSRPTWVTSVPSRQRPWLMPLLGQRIGALGHLPYLEVFTTGPADRSSQAAMGNSAHAAANAINAIRIADAALATAPSGPVLLLDDTRLSGWTLTVAADALTGAGVAEVLPLVVQRGY